jgi:hypothetical protein
MGLALLGLPAVVLASLLGIQPATADTLIVARIAGAALLAIGVACALARDDGGLPAQRGLLTGILTYDVVVTALLVYAALVLRQSGLALLPAVILHSLLSVWCIWVLAVGGRTMAPAPPGNGMTDDSLPPDPPVPTADAPERPGAERISVWFHIGIAASDRTRADAGAGTGPTATRRTDRAGRVAPDAGARFPNRCWGFHFMQNEGRALAAPRLATQVDAIWLHSTGR